MDLNSIGTNLVFISDLTEIDFRATDLGKELSEAIKDHIQDTKIGLIANDKVHDLIEKNSFLHNSFGKVYAIKNIGILFEPELKIDFVALCKKFSRDTHLVIEHKGDINNENIYFLTRKSGKKIELKDLNYTIQ